MWDEILTISFLTAFLSSAVRLAVPLIYTSLGEMISEKAGVLNIGLEANMICGAFAGFAAAYYTNSLFVGFLAGIAAGALCSLIHGFLTISLRQDQTVTGIALNILMVGLTSFLFQAIVNTNGSYPQIQTLGNFKIPVLGSIPVIGESFFNKDIVTYLSYIMIIVLAVLLYRTAWGLNIVSVGENPRAADTVGINVYRVRFLAALFNGAMGGIGGAYLILVQLGLFSESVTAGRGYIALAIVAFGKRKPTGVFLAALFFGMADAVQFRMQALGIDLPTQLFTGLPYVLTVVALVIGAVGKKKEAEPEALSKPYIRSMR